MYAIVHTICILHIVYVILHCSSCPGVNPGWTQYHRDSPASYPKCWNYKNLTLRLAFISTLILGWLVSPEIHMLMSKSKWI